MANTIPNRLTPLSEMQSYIAGEIAYDGATQVQALHLDSNSEQNNVYGRAYEFKDATKGTVKEYAGGVFAGIMISPKEGPPMVEHGAAGAYVRNGEVSRFLRIGDGVAVALDDKPATNVVGAQVYAKPDGSLTTASDAGAPIPAIVQWHTPAEADSDGNVLAVISLQHQIPVSNDENGEG